ncbi:MBOAT family O-acyltransferase [Anaerocolumna xylanovorans]|uniref:Alginate O-acetyltransferase complex protein AlgI n=1 Tax=Anaerocolumna xylanovorans DSM 12503 TaxID=1121345 RepID=A0A1M7XX88_9FIRM|nr:MBOAT family O-acyltransferase [Anaerocolumna xylanovorans]SHO43251.1 alginate O-acetyltransferase complex protein AlgI [Anaerocolumna xylanovorans DSM 12503]
MLFSSITFLYYFLPVVLLLYFLMPFRYKNMVLLIASLIFYAWGEPVYCILMLLSILQGYFIGLRIEGTADSRKAKVLMASSIVISLSILGFFKYFDFFIANVNKVTHLSLPFLRIALPMGISFYTFHIMSYTIDVYRGKVKAEKDILAFMTYAMLFPQLVAGPIVRYADIAKQLHEREHSLSQCYLGSRRFVAGLAKKVLLANSFGVLCTKFQDSSDKSVLFYWIYAIAYTLQIYYDFSGYSDMAIGLGKIFGFQFIENFNYPYISKSITEFWRRWHISLSSWFRDYVYIPLGGNRVSKFKHIRNILIVWMLTGFWHGAAWNFILWGLYFAILLILEKYCFPKWTEKGNAVLSHIYVMVLVIISFVLFNADSLSQAGSDIGSMFGLSDIPFVSTQALYYLSSYGVLLLVGITGSTPLFKVLYEKFAEKGKGAFLFVILEPVVLCSLLLVITGYLVDGSFNPFLYFRF